MMTTSTSLNSFYPAVAKVSFVFNRSGVRRGMRSLVSYFILLAITCVSPMSLLGSDQIPGAKQDRPIAIFGATVHPVSGPVIESGIVVFDKGKITQVGKDLVLPAGFERIQADGKHVYPGLIEAYSNLGLVEINSVRATVDYREVGDNNANVRAAAAFNPDSEIIPVNRANGILLAVSAPSGGIISGRSSLMMLDGWTWEDMTLQPDIGMHIDWPSSESRLEELEEYFELAKRYVEARSQGTRQPRDLRLESLSRVLDGSLPVIVDATSVEQIEAAVAFSTAHGLKLIILGGYDANRCAKLLKANDIPVIISGVYRNPRRRNTAYDAPYAFPSVLQSLGIKYCISAGGRFGANGLRNLPYNAATAAAYGLSPEDALRSITLSVAEILGVDDRVGSLDVGKDATLFIADGDILETPTQVEQAFIQGRAVDLDNKHKQLYRKYSEKYERLAE